MSRLKKIRVRGLLGRFDHEVDIDPKWEFVILHGPNGVGKTKLLQICDAMLRGDALALKKIPFFSAECIFDDGNRLEARRSGNEQLELVPESDAEPQHVVVSMSLWNHGKSIATWTSEITEPRRGKELARRLDAIDEVLPLARLGDATWQDPTSGRPLHLNEVLERFGELIPQHLLYEIVSTPNEATRFLESQSVHLIATQRLLSLDRAARTRRRRDDLFWSFAEDRTAAPREAVVELSQDLASRISVALAQNSRISQQQDKTFPHRLLSNEEVEATESEVRHRYASQVDLRKQLAEIGVLDQSPELPLPNERLESWQIRAVSLHLGDSAIKLATFENLLQKVNLLREVVNSRFLHKEMRVDAERGFYFVTDDNLDLSASELSSGEQHEIVLLYRLLFSVPAGSLVLIDEPEISLHIRWQQEVLNDLRRISEIAGLYFIVATHSPYIVHNWTDRMVALSGEESVQ